ncbi:uncharacterized protein LOC121051427 [Rosa chinensis]|uniref:uncharacterized protein LOC121051427 n=1 Tax=Rosa chinensis TaxID=74649 RepID=UPI001AD8FADF|nr:uncharacterized protein LOC121051427 [Rosa chinensis]
MDGGLLVKAGRVIWIGLGPLRLMTEAGLRVVLGSRLQVDGGGQAIRVVGREIMIRVCTGSAAASAQVSAALLCLGWMRNLQSSTSLLAYLLRRDVPKAGYAICASLMPRG